MQQVAKPLTVLLAFLSFGIQSPRESGLLNEGSSVITKQGRSIFDLLII